MSAWPEALPAGPLSLTGTEGELISVSIAVEPRMLEGLLEALAELPFPVNPEIYHHAPMAPAGRHGAANTLVEFPAYAGRLLDIRNAVERRGFAPESVRATNMLEQIRGRGYNTNW